ncbi:MAG: thioredoxin family protein, partial [Opitutaceae bacterium]|nr:thioredoxin family protein [Opitutaceae bacterium]
DIQWPAPIVLRDARGDIVGNGYSGDLLLPVTLTPPADLQTRGKIEINAQAAWLMCHESCVPGSASLSLVLDTTNQAPALDPNLGPKIRAVVDSLPKPDPAWKMAASRVGGMVRLSISHVGPSGHDPRGLRFFSADGLISHEAPQAFEPDGRGGGVLMLALAPDGPTNVQKLVGVVTAENGWVGGRTLPGLSVEVDLPPLPVEAGTAAAASLPGTLLLAFVGGLILNLMPCVFPVLGLKILGFVNQAGHQRRRVVAHGLAFTVGVLVSFWALATALAVLRAGGSQLGWGFQLQSPAFVYALAVLLLVFAMNMSGVFEFGMRASSVVANARWVQKRKSEYAESLLTGVLATAVATPCSAPFLAPALGAALAVSTVESFVIFTAIAVGLSTPYLLLSAFPRAVKLLPRPGAWMETFKQFMAFPLYATVAYLAWVLAAQTSEEGLRGVLVSLALVAMAVWIYGRWTAPGASAARLRFGVVGLLVVGTWGLWLGWPRGSGSAGPDDAPKVVWEPWSPEAVARLRAEGRTVYVDFTARWCATCQTNKKFVFGSDELRRFFAEKKIATLRADWTGHDPRITAELARHGRSAVPFNLLWTAGSDSPVVLPEILTAGKVLETLQLVRVAAK